MASPKAAAYTPRMHAAHPSSGPARPLVRVKICGITREQDARLAVDLGVHALGFNTWKGGKRFLDVHAAGEWIAALPPFISKVALLVNASLEEAQAVAELSYIDALQLHGDETPDYCREVAQFGRPIIKALRVQSAGDFQDLERWGTRHFLLDAHVPGQFGGTGVVADLDLVRQFTAQYPLHALILAGGLRPENVAAAIASTHPWAVDVSSGVESAPGQKDAGLMRAFMEAVQMQR